MAENNETQNELNENEIGEYEEISDEIILANVERINAEIDAQYAIIRQSDAQLSINKIESLRELLSAQMLDENKTVMSSEPHYKILITGTNRNLIINKLMEIVNTL